MKIGHIKLPVLKPILVFTTYGQKCPHSEPEEFTFDNFQSNHPVVRVPIFEVLYFQTPKSKKVLKNVHLGQLGTVLTLLLNPKVRPPRILTNSLNLT